MSDTVSLPMPSSPAYDPLEDRSLFEIVDGQRVELPPMSIWASRVASRLMSYLGHFLVTHRLGEALTETLIRLPLPHDRNRRPDVAFVSNQRIAQAPSQPGTDNAWDVVPELIVEVVSPHDLVLDLLERLSEYWSAGVQLVWVVVPDHRLIYVCEAPRQVRILGDADELEGGQVLPGLRIPIASLFPA